MTEAMLDGLRDMAEAILDGLRDDSLNAADLLGLLRSAQIDGVRLGEAENSSSTQAGSGFAAASCSAASAASAASCSGSAASAASSSSSSCSSSCSTFTSSTSIRRYSILSLLLHRKEWPDEILLEMVEVLRGCGASVQPWFMSMGCVCSKASILAWVMDKIDLACARSYCINTHTPLHGLVGYHSYCPVSMDMLLATPFAAEWLTMRCHGFGFTPLAYAAYMSNTTATQRLARAAMGEEPPSSEPRNQHLALLACTAGPIACIPCMLPIFVANSLCPATLALCSMIRSALEEQQHVHGEVWAMQLWLDLVLVHTPRTHLFALLSRSSVWGGFWKSFRCPNHFVRLFVDRISHDHHTHQPSQRTHQSVVQILISCGAFGSDLLAIADAFEESPYYSDAVFAMFDGVLRDSSVSVRRLLLDPRSVAISVRREVLLQSASPVPWHSMFGLDTFPTLLHYGVHAGGLEGEEPLWTSLLQTMDLGLCKHRVAALVWLSDVDDVEVRRRLEARNAYMEDYGMDSGNDMTVIAGMDEMRELVEEVLVYRSELRGWVRAGGNGGVRFPYSVRVHILAYLVPVVVSAVG